MLLISMMCMLLDAAQLQPISPDDLTHCDRVLLLSEAQRLAVTHQFELYLEQCDEQLRDIPNMPRGHPREHEVYQQRSAILEVLDEGFFEAVSNVCTPEQAQWIPILRTARQRQRCVAAMRFSHTTGRPFAFLDDVMLSSPWIDPETVRERLIVYAHESALRLKALEEECDDLWDRCAARLRDAGEVSPQERQAIGEEEGRESLRLANRIDDLNIQWALDFVRALPTDQAADVMARFGTAQYRGAEQYWLKVRVYRELLGGESVVPATAIEFREAVDALFRTRVTEDFPLLTAKARAVIYRVYPVQSRWPDGTPLLEYTRQLSSARGDDLQAICDSQLDGLSADALMEFWQWAARRAQQESPHFGGKSQLLVVRQPAQSFTEDELQVIAAKISVDEASRATIDLIIEQCERSMRELRQTGVQSADAYVRLSHQCLDDIQRVLPRGTGDDIIRAARDCLDRAPFFSQSKTHGFAALDVARLALTNEALTARILSDHLASFHAAVYPLLEARDDDNPDIEDRVRARMRGEANAKIAAASYDLINGLTLGKPGLATERERLLRIIMPSLFFERDSLAAIYHEQHAAASNPTQRERIEDAWVDYLAKDDSLLRELLSLASKAHAWSRRSDGVMIPLVPTETGDLIAKATQLTEQRDADAAMIRRTLTLSE